MATELERIDDGLRRWIGRQPMFFVGSAPLAEDGHVNLSPKGPIGTLAVLGEHEIAYVDLIGSGAETIAHLRENGRVTVMLCAFQGPPKIIRLYGRGAVILPEDEGFEALASKFDVPVDPAARRAVVRVQVTRIIKSCGYTVPLMEPAVEREHMPKWVDKKLRVGGEQALRDYQDLKNATSLDGLPGVPART
jgi:hypothetical protein